MNEPSATRPVITPRVKPSFRLPVLWRFALCFAAALAAFAVPQRVLASNRWETLEAIHRIENPRNTMVPGRHGELGAYQFRSSTWRMHTTLPFERALDRPTAEAVAVRHYEWLRRGLIRNGLEDSSYNIALAWNGGLMAAVQGRASSSAREYAERVNNIVGSLRAGRLAASP